MTRTISIATAFLLGLFIAGSCGKYDILGFVMSTSDDPDKRFATSIEYNAKNGYRSIRCDADEYGLFVFSDSHIKNKASRKLEAFSDAYVNYPGTAPAALFLGDIVDGKDGWDLFMKGIEPIYLHGNFFATAGNHDLYFGQWPEYVKRLGTSTYWFEIVCPSAGDLYISLDSASGTLGSDQREWLENLLKEKSSQYRHVIVFTHTHFFKRDGKQGHTSNYAMEETYDLADLFSRYGVDLVLTGHRHFRDEQVFKGVRYITTDCLEESESYASYIVCKVGSGTGVEYVSLP